MNLEYPRLVFISPGNISCQGGTYADVLVKNDEELKLALEEGFFMSIPEALTGKKAEEPKVEEPKVEEPKVEEPKVEEPKVEEPKVEEPKVEEPKVEEPKVEEPKVEEPKVLDLNVSAHAGGFKLPGSLS